MSVQITLTLSLMLTLTSTDTNSDALQLSSLVGDIDILKLDKTTERFWMHEEIANENRKIWRPYTVVFPLKEHRDVACTQQEKYYISAIVFCSQFRSIQFCSLTVDQKFNFAEISLLHLSFHTSLVGIRDYISMLLWAS